ncbi:MAG: carbamoyltransferase HypF [Anaerolineae bacterium]|nr:carbamoyltransferase HypF [Thermoflexales bacterium]MDW8406249.1 carbamoyltransferase HypF [Anaerolineae bacterium]
MQQDRLARLRLAVRGAVQGVGFRPFVYRLATELGLTGWVINNAQGVFIEVEGAPSRLEDFRRRIEADKPAHALIQSVDASYLQPIGFTDFQIRHSDDAGDKTVIVLPDLATCADCRREIFDPSNRRYRYPFTNCTHCGPRYTIIESLPYDRPNTSMRLFPMCDRCRAEYENPLDRRFHAQPNACPVCGPRLALWDTRGVTQLTEYDALLGTAEAIRRGQIVAVKGLGGFHLMVDARNDDAVMELRRRKQREEKPFALMVPWAHDTPEAPLRHVEALCRLSPLESHLLQSPQAPIVLLRKRDRVDVSKAIAPPPNPYLGIMLPYTPLHHLLMAELGFPVVATSGNLSDEPICIDEQEALARLAGIADGFLVHNRAIVRHVDDSVVCVICDAEGTEEEMVLRRARGYAPLPVIGKTANTLHHASPGNRQSARADRGSILAVGAHLKNAVALAIGDTVFISQHIGDLDTAQAYEAFCRVIDSVSGLYQVTPDTVACDLHPDYLSTRFAESYARERGLPLIRVQHHLAHGAACLAENDLSGPALGVSWDGTGYGLDGTIWGGEFLRIGSLDQPSGEALFERVAALRPFRLPGGERAVKEPRRAALGVLHELFGDQLWEMDDLPPIADFAPAERAVLQRALKQNVNAPITTSAGRLFDAVAALAGLRQRAAYEGQAAMHLEFAIDGLRTDEAYPFSIVDSAGAEDALSSFASEGQKFQHPPSDRIESWVLHSTRSLQIDWAPLIQAVIDDVRALNHQSPVFKHQVSVLAARFHNALVEMIVAIARRIHEPHVALSGGCFQNRYLLEHVIRRLRAEGFQPHWHRQAPTNDGGIALGQVAVARRSRWTRDE